ncbi:MAG: carbohydrate ABC transporter permease [Oscillospiraceae bacterium]|nr:carbohydrate ABC transporter permease [Oscillospiraceae bacterium]
MDTTQRKNISVFRVLLYLIAITVALLWLFPIVWMIFSSLKPFGTPVAFLDRVFSPPFTLDNYFLLPQRAPIWRWTFNSVLVAGVVTAGVLVMSSLAGYALSKIKFKGSKILFVVIAAGLMVPIEAIVIPLFLTIIDLNLLNTHVSLIVPSFAAPLGVLIMKQYYDSIPNELVEAAAIDGSSYFRTWFSVCLPLSRSALAAVGIITFTNSWNNFLWPFLAAQNSRMFTLPVGLPVFQDLHVEEFTMPMTASVFASIPALLVFIFFQKQIVRGIAMSGIKG